MQSWLHHGTRAQASCAAHLAGKGGQDVALQDVEEARGDLGADRQDLVEVQQLRQQAND